MEALMKQLRELPALLGALPAGLKLVLVVGALTAIGVGAWSAVSGAEAYQYAFTNLTPEDSTEAAAALKASGLPFRLDAGGSALAVPASRVHDARLLLASAGLPRGGGVGFEIFDRGDLGVSEFTQRVNLRRATEGELARTISRLSEVRSARVHVTLAERGLYRDQDRPASAAVVLQLQPGRKVNDRELAGIRHLVASAVPGLDANQVTVVDGRGQTLTAEAGTGEAMAHQRRLERDLEQRVVDILGQAVGPGAVVARVTATLDQSEVQTSQETVDPDQSAVRSERRVSQQSQGEGASSGGLAGAAANQPLAGAAPATGGRGRTTSTMEDQVRNFDVSRTTTSTVVRVPRLQRLSVAVIVDGKDGKARPDEELKRLGDLARRAVGFDAARGDELDISSAPFTRSEKEEGAAATAPPPPSVLQRPPLVWIAAGAGALILVGLLFMGLRRRPALEAQPLLTPGARVAEIEAAIAREASALAPPLRVALTDPAAPLRDRARELAAKDPTRAAHILKAWMAQETTPHRTARDA